DRRRRSWSSRSPLCTNPSERGGHLCSLADRALGVELGGHVGAADQVQPRVVGRTRPAELVVEVAYGLLAGADDHVVTLDELADATDGDVQAGVVDPVVGGAGDLAYARLLQHGAVGPARRLAQADPDRGLLALHQRHLASNLAGLGLGDPAAV